jgi:hypothetical protein
MRFQLRFWDLLEFVAGAATASAIVAEFGYLGFLIALTTIAMAILVVRAATPVVRAERLAAVVAVGSLVLLGLGMVVAREHSRSDARQSFCSSNLRQIVIALHGYQGQYGCFPPPYLVGRDGKPWHSWRVQILPWLDEGRAIYGQYDFSQPWNALANRRLAAFAPEVLVCPAHHEVPAGVTDYYYVVGLDRWPTGTETIGRRQIDAGDGAADTILLVESHTVLANWMEPRDLSADEVLHGINASFQAPCACSSHGAGRHDAREGEGGALVAFCEGSIQLLPARTEPADLRAFLTFDGGEDLSDFRHNPPQLPWDLSGAWVLLLQLLFAAFMVLRRWPRRRAALSPSVPP